MKYVYKIYCNTVQRIEVEAENEDEASDKAWAGEGEEGKEEVLESWVEIDKKQTREVRRHG